MLNIVIFECEVLFTLTERVANCKYILNFGVLCNWPQNLEHNSCFSALKFLFIDKIIFFVPTLLLAPALNPDSVPR